MVADHLQSESIYALTLVTIRNRVQLVGSVVLKAGQVSFGVLLAHLLPLLVFHRGTRDE